MVISRMVLAVLVAAPLLRADVLVVDADGGGDFTTLSAAVAAAAPGDTILMRDGDYVEASQVVVDGKPLTIVADPADPAPTVTVTPGLLVRNLAPTEFVVIENLALVGGNGSASAPATSGLVLSDNQSHVRVQGCTIDGGSGLHNNNRHGAPALQVLDNYSAAIIGCTVIGGHGQFSPTLSVMTGNGGAGLLLDVGQVHVSYSVIRGGDGGGNIIGGWAQGGDGGHGVAHSMGTLLIAGSSLNGGSGGVSHFGGDGGDGLQLGDTGFAWLMADSLANYGDGGSSDEGPHGLNGVAIDDAFGLATDFGGSRHGFELTSPLREGQLGSLDFDGDPSDSTLLFASLSMHQLGFPGKQGVFMLFPTTLIGPFALGAGSGGLALTAPALPASLEALNLHLQPVYLGVDGVVIGAGRVLTILDASF